MKYFWLIFLLPFSVNIASASGIDFFHGTWEEAIEKADKEGKVIFVDAYTTWCGPCKRMAKNVFTNEEVGNFYNSHFVNMKIDMEKKDGITFQRKYPVAAFPTLYFIDGKGKVVQKVKGAQDVERFLKLGKTVLSKVDFSAEFAEAYKAGDRSPELIHNYVKGLNKSGKSSGKIVNDYLKTQKDLGSPFNQQFLFDAVAEADSKVFDQFIGQKAGIVKLVGKEAFLEKVEKACNKTLQKSISYKSADLKEEAKEKMKANHPDIAGDFSLSADLKFFLEMKDAKAFSKTAKIYEKKVVKNDPVGLNKLSNQIKTGFPKDSKMLAQALAYAESACKYGVEPEFHLNYAELLYQNNQKDLAITIANKALELSKGDRIKEANAQNLLRKLENG